MIGKRLLKTYPFPVPPDIVDIRPAPFHKTHESMRYCVDFALSIGTPIRAVANGVVIERESRFSRAYAVPSYKNCARANYVTIRHHDGRSSYYVHLKWRSVKVRVGQKVRQGQVIALSGDTGYAAYPHLHFGLYENENNIPVRFAE